MDDYTMFVKGKKPALYDTLASKRFSKRLPTLNLRYPYIEDLNLIPDSKFYLFFQDEESKQSFLSETKGVAVPSPDFHRILGMALGYPPKAVDFFVKCEQDRSMENLKIGMHYQGISCSGNVYNLIENCNWLWEKYTFDRCSKEPLEVRIGYNMHKAEKGDIQRLRELQEIALARTSLINT